MKRIYIHEKILQKHRGIIILSWPLDWLLNMPVLGCTGGPSSYFYESRLIFTSPNYITVSGRKFPEPPF